MILDPKLFRLRHPKTQKFLVLAVERNAKEYETA